VRQALAIAWLALSAPPALARGEAGSPLRVELAPFVGFFWSTSLSTSAGEVTTSPTADLGLALGFSLSPNTQLEILYAYAAPPSRLTPPYGTATGSDPFTVRFQYFLVGGAAAFPSEALEPFVSGGLGALWVAPSDARLTNGRTVDLSDAWYFAFSLGGGLKWFFSRTLGLRLQARVFLPVLFQSGAFYSGPGGAALTVNGGIPLVQGDLGVGLIVAP
jgi:hypothetical protein